MYLYCYFYLYRLVSSSGKSSGVGEHCTFGIRTGTSKGVSTRGFRVECARDLASWVRGLVQATHNAVAAIREVAWGKITRSFFPLKAHSQFF